MPRKPLGKTAMTPGERQKKWRDRARRAIPQRRRLPDASQEGPAAAGPALFQRDAEVTAGRVGNDRG
jgi:hypothetical protein